jgi:tetratricopeptide (TPR) repeat protein
MVAGHHRALILALEGRGEEAAEVARELTALAPSNADEWYAKGFAMLMLKRADEGRECLEKALSLDPTHAWALNDLSGLKERHADALALLETGLKAHPNDPELLYNKACNQLWMGNPKGCLTTLSRLVEVAPKDAEAWILQGETLHAMERFQEAVEALQRGLGLDPKSAKGWSTAGQALCDMGELERGLDCFEKAVGLLPDDGGLWHDKGRAHGLMKDYKRATECFERCLELDPDNEDARELLTACRAAGF